MIQSLRFWGIAALVFAQSLGSAPAFRSIVVGSEVPTLRVEDLTGQPMDIGFGERISLLLFWRPDQKFSLEALRDLERLHGEISHKGVEIIAVAEGRSATDQVREAVASLQLSYPVYLDRQRKTEEEYGVIVFPSTGIVDESGQLQFYLPSRNSNYEEILKSRVDVELGVITIDEFDRRMERAGEELGAERFRADGHRKSGQLLLQQGKAEQAIEEFHQALVLDPELMDAHLSLGYAYLDTNRFEEAEGEFQWVLERYPASPGARVGIGICTVQTGELEKGILQLKDAVMLNPDPVRGYFELGKAYERKGDLSQALQAYRWAVRKLLQGRQ